MGGSIMDDIDMTEKEYQTELMKIVGMFSHDIVEIVQRRMTTICKEQYECPHCGEE
jgi:hypothetical protein